MYPKASRGLLVLTCLAASIAAFGQVPALKRFEPVPADEPIPVVDFFRAPLFENPQFNPDGSRMAAIVSTANDRLDLITMDLGTKWTERITGKGDYDIYDFDWLSERRLVFRISEEKRYSTGMFAAELGGFTSTYVLQRYNVVVPVGFPRGKPNEMIVWIKYSASARGGDGGAIKIDTRRNALMSDDEDAINVNDDGVRAKILHTYPEPKGGTVVAYIANREGELAWSITAKNGVATLHRFSGNKWIVCSTDLDEIDILGVGDREGELLVLATKEAGKPKPLYRYDAITDTLGELLYEDERYDIKGVRFYRHPVDGRVLGMEYGRNGPQAVWFDMLYARIQEGIQRNFPNKIARIIGSDEQEKHFFVRVFSDTHPSAYYHLDQEKRRVDLITNTTPWIDPNRMQPMQVIAYKTRDGKDIEGYLTLPAGASKEKPAPLVVLPHGGPWVRDHWGWNAEVQFLASRGYAVFQPNYRGSPGYAWRFSDEDMWEFRKMHDDVTDGVKRLLRSGLIDRDRIAIMGGSFGGYLALCGAVYEEDLYRCAITIAGVFDWEEVLSQSRRSEYRRTAYGVLRRNLGDPKANEEKFFNISPARQVNQIKIPIFVAHGTADEVAAVAQSKSLISELKKQGVPHETQIVRGEGHGFAKIDKQVRLYTEIEAFLAKHMAPRAPAQP